MPTIIEKLQNEIVSLRETPFLPFCSDNIYQLIQKKQHELDRRINFKNRNIQYDNKHIIEKFCPVCNNNFLAPENKIYCSRRCAKKAYRYRRKQRGKFPFSEKICIVCGLPFIPRTTKQVACSPECSKKYMLDTYGRDKSKIKGNLKEEQQEIQPENQIEPPIDEYQNEYKNEYQIEYIEENMTIEQNPRIYIQWAQHDKINIALRLDKKIKFSAIPSYMVDEVQKTAHSLDATLRDWRKQKPARQAAIIRICIDRGFEKIMNSKIFNLFRLGKWEDARSYLLMTKWNNTKGEAVVALVNQLVSGVWNIKKSVQDNSNSNSNNDNINNNKTFIQGELL